MVKMRSRDVQRPEPVATREDVQGVRDDIAKLPGTEAVEAIIAQQAAQIAALTAEVKALREDRAGSAAKKWTFNVKKDSSGVISTVEAVASTS